MPRRLVQSEVGSSRCRCASSLAVVLARREATCATEPGQQFSSSDNSRHVRLLSCLVRRRASCGSWPSHEPPRLHHLRWAGRNLACELAVKNSVALSPLGAVGGKSTREHRIRLRSQRLERLQFQSLGPPRQRFAEGTSQDNASRRLGVPWCGMLQNCFCCPK
jgi:hypothetical protein